MAYNSIIISFYMKYCFHVDKLKKHVIACMLTRYDLTFYSKPKYTCYFFCQNYLFNLLINRANLSMAIFNVSNE